MKDPPRQLVCSLHDTLLSVSDAQKLSRAYDMYPLAVSPHQLW
jgi:hypothetical protein